MGHWRKIPSLPAPRSMVSLGSFVTALIIGLIGIAQVNGEVNGEVYGEVHGEVQAEAVSQAWAASSSVSQSASQAAVCSGCHAAIAGEGVPALVRDAKVLEQQMLALRGSNGETAMHRLIKAYDADEIRSISAALTQQDSDP